VKLYLLRRLGSDQVAYDEAEGFVVRAKSHKMARDFAACRSGEEGEICWTNPDFSTCEEINADGVGGVVLRDFKAG
jgi:hypothetical protein